MAKDTSVESRFMADDGARQGILEEKRQLAALTWAQYLPPKDYKADDSLPKPFTAKGRQLTIGLAGQIHSLIFQAGLPFFMRRASAAIRYLSEENVELIEAFEDRLAAEDLHLQSLLETAGQNDPNPIGFYQKMAEVTLCLCILGDAQLRLNDDYTITRFRLDNYVRCNDDSGRVRYVIVRECIDVATLSPDKFEASGLKAEILDQSCKDRERDLYTLCEYDHKTKKWKYTQEINQHVIHEETRSVPHIFGVSLNLATPENYGRGYADQIGPDLITVNGLRQAAVKYAAAASQILWVVGKGSQLRAEDLMKRSGTVVEGGHVAGGVVQDVAPLRFEKLADFKIVEEVMASVIQEINESALFGNVRESERTTAFEVDKVYLQRQEQAIGHYAAPIADSLQTQLLKALIDTATRNKHHVPAKLKDGRDGYDISILTGLRALQERAKASRLLTIAQVAQQLGPEAVQYLKADKLFEMIMRLQAIREPGMIRSDAEVQAIKTQSELATKAVDVAGNVAEAAGIAAVTPQQA